MRKESNLTWTKLFGEVGAFVSFALVVGLFIVMTINGLFYGEYGTTIYSNKLGEHYIELIVILVFFGFYIYEKGFIKNLPKVRFTLHPNRQN
jgi:hypothetical protein